MKLGLGMLLAAGFVNGQTVVPQAPARVPVVQAAPADEQVELAALQSALAACGVASAYNVRDLVVYCSIARLAGPIEARLDAALRARAQAKPKEKK